MWKHNCTRVRPLDPAKRKAEILWDKPKHIDLSRLGWVLLKLDLKDKDKWLGAYERSCKICGYKCYG